MNVSERNFLFLILINECCNVFTFPIRALEAEQVQKEAEERWREQEREKTKQRLIDIAEATKKKTSLVPSARLAMVAGVGGSKLLDFFCNFLSLQCSVISTISSLPIASSVIKMIILVCSHLY